MADRIWVRFTVTLMVVVQTTFVVFVTVSRIDCRLVAAKASVEAMLPPVLLPNAEIVPLQVSVV